MVIFTKTLTSGTFVIDFADGVSMLTIQPQASSSCTILGGVPFKGENSSAITISNNSTFTIASESPSSPLAGITITWVSGTVDIVVGL